MTNTFGREVTMLKFIVLYIQGKELYNIYGNHNTWSLNIRLSPEFCYVTALSKCFGI